MLGHGSAYAVGYFGVEINIQFTANIVGLEASKKYFLFFNLLHLRVFYCSNIHFYSQGNRLASRVNIFITDNVIFT